MCFVNVARVLEINCKGVHKQNAKTGTRTKGRLETSSESRQLCPFENGDFS